MRIGIAGAGRIARLQHVPAIAATPGMELVAIADPGLPTLGPSVRSYLDLDAMLAGEPALDAVAICTPPQVRGGLAAAALARGKHVLLEKPPAATVSEVAALGVLAERLGLTLFTAWHSLFSNAADRARDILAARRPVGMHVVWKEDFRKYHPGADWFWQPGGLGVFDAGINAFAIMLHAMPEPIFVRTAVFMMPEGAQAPVAARLCFATPTRTQGFTSEHDWNLPEGETWTIDWRLQDGGKLLLTHGGAGLSLDGVTVVSGPDEEYRRLYGRFRELILEGRSEIEVRPLQLVADAFLLARHVPVAGMVPGVSSCHDTDLNRSGDQKNAR